LLTHELTL